MPRSVYQVEHIPLAVGRAIVHTRRLELDGDASLPLDVHVVEKLRLHLALLD